MSTIVYLAKFFEREEHAAGFVAGHLYCKTLRKYKKMEDRNGSGRADSDEGTTAWLQPDEVDIQILGINVTQLAAPVQVQMNWLDDLHLFCMVAGHTGIVDTEKLTTSNIDDLRRELIVPEDCLQLGDNAVAVTNVTEFLKRMDAALQERNYPYERGLVKYYDPGTFHGSFRGVEAAFRKQDRFSYQREFRFAIRTGQEGHAPLHLEIGDISDITVRLHSSRLWNDDYLTLNVNRHD